MAAKSLFSNSGGSPSAGMGDPERAVNTGMANQNYAQTQEALARQKAFTDSLNGAQGLQNQSDVYKQYADIAAGRGPNPAQTMLNQATGQNVAQTGALMGSARGASANPGMMARQVGMMGGAQQQAAAGQAATLQANQSLGALGQMGGIAGQQVGQQMQGQQAMTAAEQAQYGQMLNAIAQQNATAAGLQGNINSGNVSEANSARDLGGKIAGGLASGAASGFGMSGQNGVSNAPMPGMTGPPTQLHAGGGMIDGAQPSGPRSAFGQAVMGMARGGKVPARVSPGEIYLSPKKAAAVAKGKASPLSGERIKGKAKVKGDSYSNDVVSKTLQSGGVVIPRSKAQGDDVAEKASAFVRAVMARGR